MAMSAPEILKFEDGIPTKLETKTITNKEIINNIYVLLRFLCYSLHKTQPC